MIAISQPVGGAEIRQTGAPEGSGAPSKKTAGAAFQNAPVSGAQNSAVAVEPVGRAERPQRRDNDRAPDQAPDRDLSSSKPAAASATQVRVDQARFERADESRPAAETRRADAVVQEQVQVERADDARRADAVARDRADAARRVEQDRELRASQSEAVTEHRDIEVREDAARAEDQRSEDRAAATQAAISYSRSDASEPSADRRVDLSV